MTLTTLEDVFARGLRHLHAAHQQGARQVAINHEMAHDPRLQTALRAGMALNLKQVERLAQVFASVGLPVVGDPDRAMAGIADDNNVVIARMTRSPALDDELIRSGQLAAHFYLANYGTMRSYARALGHRRAARLLGKTVDENAATDEAFTKLALKLRSHTASKVLKGLGVTVATGFAVAGAIALADRDGSGQPRVPTPPRPRKIEGPVAVAISD